MYKILKHRTTIMKDINTRERESDEEKERKILDEKKINELYLFKA